MERIYITTQTFSPDEQYGLMSQMRRAAVSIPSNIAEGHGRKTKGEFIQFLRIAFGSSSELETQLLISHRLKMLKQKEYDELDEQLTLIRKMLNKLITSTRRLRD